MADFRTHVSVATGAGVMAAGALWCSGVASVGQLPWLVATVALGGIMPDVDSDHSTSVRLIFNLLGLAAAVGIACWPPTPAGWTGLLGLALGAWVLVRDIGSVVFKHYSRHRANWHSLLAVAWVSLLTVAAAHQYAHKAEDTAWLYGAAMALGMLIHLLLDECYSVDLAGQRFKRSFGTALKLYDGDHLPSALLMCALAAATYPWLPDLPSYGNMGSLWSGMLALAR